MQTGHKTTAPLSRALHFSLAVTFDLLTSKAIPDVIHAWVIYVSIKFGYSGCKRTQAILWVPTVMTKGQELNSTVT